MITAWYARVINIRTVCCCSKVLIVYVNCCFVVETYHVRDFNLRRSSRILLPLQRLGYHGSTGGTCDLLCNRKNRLYSISHTKHKRRWIKVIVGVWCIFAMSCDRCTCVVPTLRTNWTVCSTTSWRVESLSLSLHSFFLHLIPTGTYVRRF